MPKRWEWLPHWKTLLSAAFAALVFPMADIAPLAFIALIPWFSHLSNIRSRKENLFQGFWMGFFSSLGSFYWVSHVLTEFGNLPWIVATLFLVIFCCFNHIHYLAFALFFRWTRDRLPKSSFQKALLLTFAYGCLDQLIPKLFMNELGHSTHQLQYIRQIADLSGVPLITSLIVFTNLTLYYWWKNQHYRSKNWKPLLPLALFWAFSLGYGCYRYQEFSKKTADAPESVRFALIQANVGDLEKAAAEQGLTDAADHVVQNYLALSGQALQLFPPPEFVVWPETAYPSRFRKPSYGAEALRDRSVEQWVKDYHTPLLFGGYHSDSRYEYNSFFFLTPDMHTQLYSKSILLLFGETIPGAELFPSLAALFPQVGNFGKGPGPVSLTLERSNPNQRPFRVQPLICYEVLYSSFVRAGVNLGADILLNITNDSWFGPWGEPQQHFALSTFRTIETRRPLVRSTNTGISGLVLPNGDIQKESEIGQAEILTLNVPLLDTPTKTPYQTLYLRLGNWYGWLMWIGVIAFLWTTRKRTAV